MTAVRIWELTVLLSFLATLAYWWYAIRNGFSLGMLLGFSCCFGWTWLFDQPFLLNISFNPRAIDGFTWGGRWEPLWTAFSYSALALPILACLRHSRTLTTILGLWRYPLIGYAVSLPIQVYEGAYGVRTLKVETYHWKPGLLWFGVPYLNALVLVPLLVILPLIFADRLNPESGRLVTASVARRDPMSGADVVATGSAFLTGFACVQAGFYLTFVIMAVGLNALRPWTP